MECVQRFWHYDVTAPTHYFHTYPSYHWQYPSLDRFRASLGDGSESVPGLIRQQSSTTPTTSGVNKENPEEKEKPSITIVIKVVGWLRGWVIKVLMCHGSRQSKACLLRALNPLSLRALNPLSDHSKKDVLPIDVCQYVIYADCRVIHSSGECHTKGRAQDPDARLDRQFLQHLCASHPDGLCFGETLVSFCLANRYLGHRLCPQASLHTPE